jgi:hypothetical protein
MKMKRSKIFIYALLMLSLSSCIKQLDKTFEGQSVAEIDATVLNSTAATVTYPILTRVLPEGRPISTTLDSTLRRISRNVRIRINLVGPQSSKDETVGYTTFNTPINTISFPATITGQTPSRAAATLNVSDAVAGTHYTALSGKVTIPAGTSFGYIDISILAATAATQARFIGIRLDNTGSIPPSENYKELGLVIDQR